MKNIVLLILCAVFMSGFFSAPDTAKAEMLYNIDDMLLPIWEGNVAQSESVLIVEEADGTVLPVRLLYDIESVLSVKNSALTKTYEYGKDYLIDQGRLAIIKTGAIPRLTYEQFHPQSGRPGFENKNGGYILWEEGAYFHSLQIVVTYTHNGAYPGKVPESKGNLLPRTASLLKSKSPVTIVIYGDSLCEGGNSSGNPMINVSPHLPIFPDMVLSRLKCTYGYKDITLINRAVGGTDSAWGVANIREKFSGKAADLVILGFGTNDIATAPETYASNISKLISGISRLSPDAEYILLSPLYCNENAVNFFGNQVNFIDGLYQAEKKGVAFADVMQVHKDLLAEKNYADMTGNNINHINDYLARVYAQVILKTMSDGNYKTASDNIDNSGSKSDSENLAGCSGNTSAWTAGCAAALLLLLSLRKKQEKSK